MAKVVVFRPQAIKAAQQVAIPLVTKVSRQTLQGAKRLAPRGDHRHGSGRNVAGKTLLDSLHETPLRVTSASVSRQVGSTRKWAASVHQGSKRHVIRAKGKTLVFQWERRRLLRLLRRKRGVRFYFFERVNHPGNKRPRRYLTTPLAQFGRVSNFKVNTVAVSRRFLP